MSCAAYMAAGQWFCPCGLSWEDGDPDRPSCRRQRHVTPGHVPRETARALAADRRSGEERRKPNTGAVMVAAPLVLPQAIAYDMMRVIETATGHKLELGAGLRAMHAAYRILLDRLE